MRKYELIWRKRESGDIVSYTLVEEMTRALALVAALPTAEGGYITKADFFRAPADIDSGKIGRTLRAAKFFDGSVADSARAWLENLIRAYCNPDTVEFLEEQNENNET